MSLPVEFFSNRYNTLMCNGGYLLHHRVRSKTSSTIHVCLCIKCVMAAICYTIELDLRLALRYSYVTDGENL